MQHNFECPMLYGTLVVKWLYGHFVASYKVSYYYYYYSGLLTCILLWSSYVPVWPVT